MELQVERLKREEILSRQRSARANIHTDFVTGENIPPAPSDAVPITQAAYQESLKLQQQQHERSVTVYGSNTR